MLRLILTSPALTPMPSYADHQDEKYMQPQGHSVQSTSQAILPVKTASLGLGSFSAYLQGNHRRRLLKEMGKGSRSGSPTFGRIRLSSPALSSPSLSVYPPTLQARRVFVDSYCRDHFISCCRLLLSGVAGCSYQATANSGESG